MVCVRALVCQCVSVCLLHNCCLDAQVHLPKRLTLLKLNIMRTCMCVHVCECVFVCVTWHTQVHLPEGLSLLELDMIKLAAQFVARNGQSFLTGLASREHTNPQFNFLKPTHSLFGVFKTFCDAYSRVLMPPKGTKDKVAKDAADS